MPTIMKMMPPALNRLNAEVGASFGHWNSASPIPASTEFSPAMKRFEADLIEETAPVPVR